MKIEPYLFFDGRADEAVEFYRRILGAEVLMLMRFKEGPDQTMVPPNSSDKIMHMSLRIGDSVLMGSDGRCMGKPNFQGFALTITCANEGEADELFKALGDGGQVQMPLTKTFFSSRFGMVADRFGVSWMIIVAH